jgi:hypothetical protein
MNGHVERNEAGWPLDTSERQSPDRMKNNAEKGAPNVETLVTITLIVKGNTDETRDKMEQIGVRALLQDWFLEDVKVPAPYPTGSLLWYGFSAIQKKLTPTGQYEGYSKRDHAIDEGEEV